MPHATIAGHSCQDHSNWLCRLMSEAHQSHGGPWLTVLFEADRGSRAAPAIPDGRGQCLRDPCGGARRRDTGGSGGRVIRSVRGHAGCSMMLITCLSRTSLLRISPPRAATASGLFLKSGPSPSFFSTPSNCVGAIIRSTPRNSLTQPRRGLAPLGHRCNEYIPGLDLLDNPPQAPAPRHHSLIQHALVAASLPTPPAARQGNLCTVDAAARC